MTDHRDAILWAVMEGASPKPYLCIGRVNGGLRDRITESISVTLVDLEYGEPIVLLMRDIDHLIERESVYWEGES